MTTDTTNTCPAQRIDLPTTWRAMLPVLVELIERGSDEGRRIAREELERLADFADQHNAQCADR